MKKELHEGEILCEYLRKEKIHQGKLCDALGISRQGLAYHFTKSILTHEFKMQLRNNGVMLFNMDGSIGDDENLKITSKGLNELQGQNTNQLRDKYIERLEELVETYRNYNTKLKEENDRLPKK